MNVRLSKDGVIKLIRLYRSHNNLWDKNLKAFRCAKLREKSYKEISSEMGLSQEIIKKKLHSLRTAYGAQKKKALLKKPGSEIEEKCIPALFWLPEMYFLDNFIVRKATLENSKPVRSRNNVDAKTHVEIGEQIYFSPEIEKTKENIVKSTYDNEFRNESPKDFISGIEETYIRESSFSEMSSVCNPIATENVLRQSNEAEVIDQSYYEDKCRICMDENVQLDWNEGFYDNSKLTYKYCFYKYTQLKYSEEDNFSTMLCRDCANGLEYINAFISKAIESHVKLKEKLRVNMIIKTDEDNILLEAPNFEATMLEDSKIKTEVEEESLEEFVPISAVERDCSLSETRSTPSPKVIEQQKLKKNKTGNECFAKGRKKIRKADQPVCCSICSKVLSSKYKAIIHEKTHSNKYRERNETCVHCGLKFFSKHILRSHLLTHAENRQKAHKCEYCDKAFYNKSALNIHLRIHLGNMIPCMMCTKQFFRQIDLDKHMASHAVSRIDSDIGIRKKTFVRCKECGKNVRSTSFKSHTAKHKNEPLFKCSICNKEFFVRYNCRKHLKTIHKTTNAETTKLIIAFKKDRCTSLFMQQYANGELINE